MKKGVKIALTVFDILSIFGLFILGIMALFVGAFAEALVAALTLGQAETDGALITIFAPSAFILMSASFLIIPGVVCGLIKKRSKVLNIITGAIFAIVALLIITAFIVLVSLIGVNSGDNGSADSAKAFVVIGILLLGPTVVTGLSSAFMGFVPAFKKPANENA